MTGFVYVWINDLNDRYYLGSHEGSQDDGYTGSGIAFSHAVKKYGIENFTRYIHHEGPDFREEEDECLKLLDCANDPRSYNMKNDAFGMSGARWKLKKPRKPRSKESSARAALANTGQKRSKETKDRISKANKGRKQTEQAKANMSRGQINRKPHSDEYKENMSKSILNMDPDVAAVREAKISATMKTRGPKSEKTKQRMRDAWVIRRENNE